MKIVKKYFENLKLSITSIEHYLVVINRPFSNSLYFFATSMILLGAVWGTYLATSELSKLQAHFYTSLNELNENYQRDLEIIWADDQLELNQEYVDVYWPSVIDPTQHELPKTLGIISNSELGPKDFLGDSEKNTLIYVNKNSFYIKNASEEGDWSETPLASVFSEYDSFSINKQNLPKIISEIKEGLENSLGTIQAIVFIAAIPIFIISKSWFLIIESILVYLLFKIYNFGFDFKKILKLTMNVMVPVSLIQVFTNIFYSDINVPMETISFWVIISFISFHLGRNRLKKEK